MYASAGCTVAEKTFEGAEATQEDAPVSLHLDSPYQISKIVGEYYANYYHSRHGLPVIKARFQNVYGPGEVLGAGQWRGTVNTVWRNVTPTFIYKALKHEGVPVENGGIASRDLIYVEDMAEGLMACATRGQAGEVYNLASGVEIDHPRARGAHQRAGRQPDPDRPDTGTGLGPFRSTLRILGEGPPRARLRGGHRTPGRARANDRLDTREPGLDRRLHGEACGADARARRRSHANLVAAPCSSALTADRPVSASMRLDASTVAGRRRETAIPARLRARIAARRS